MLLGRWSATRSAFAAGRNLAACPRTAPRKVRGLVGSWGSGALTLRSVGQDRCRVAFDGGIGGCGRHHDRDGAFCVPVATFVRHRPHAHPYRLCTVGSYRYLGTTSRTPAHKRNIGQTPRQRPTCSQASPGYHRQHSWSLAPQPFLAFSLSCSEWQFKDFVVKATK